MASYKDETCFVIGGVNKRRTYLSSVSRYNIIKDQWESGTPALNVPRMCASACSLGDCLFVFAGVKKGRKCTRIEERLNVTAITSGGEASWKLIQLPEE